jgi:hypothetical protein
VLRTVLLTGLREHHPEDVTQSRMIASAAGWALYGAAKEWVQGQNRSSSDKVADTIAGLIAPILQTCVPAPVSKRRRQPIDSRR